MPEPRTPNPDVHQGSVKLTDREHATMRLYVREGDWITEGLIADDLYPLVLRPRLVANALQRKGLVKFGPWWDEDAGHELRLTEAGRQFVESIQSDPNAA